MGAPSTPASGGAERAGRDLATGTPGALARARADELRRQAPVRTFVARLLALHTEERGFRIGAEGEATVARRLSALERSRWHVLHAVPVGRDGCDIDHVVIGPAGVYTLNTKHHPGGRVWVGGPTVIVNGRKTPYVRRSIAEGERAARLLASACRFPVAVHPVIVVLAEHLTVRRQPEGVHVVDHRALVRWLRRQRAHLGPDRVAMIFEAARRQATWRTGAR